MSRWKALPSQLDPHTRGLVERLRELKDHGELSTRQLGMKSGYSARSWERYLGGTSLPPAEAVEALARMTGADPVPLLALREIAAGSRGTAGPGRPDTDTPPEKPEAEQEPPEPPGPGEPREPGESVEPRITIGAADAPTPAHAGRVVLAAGLVVLLLTLASVVLVLLRVDRDTTYTGADTRLPAAVSSSARPAYVCRVERVHGRWQAGISSTLDAEVSYGDVGGDVAEAQCLLRRAGISPGGIDGMFGPLTLRAVKALQQRSGLVVDGRVGPHTWQALRG